MDLAGGALDGDSHELHEFVRATYNSPKKGFINILSKDIAT